MNLEKVRDGVEVGLVARRLHPKPPHLPATARPVAATRTLPHNSRVIGRVAGLFLLLISLHRAQIHLINQIADELRQVVLRQTVEQARG